MTNPWQSILSNTALDPIKVGLKPSYIKSSKEKVKKRTQRKKRECYRPAEVKNHALVDIVGTLLCVCAGSIKIYAVLKSRGLLKQSGNVGDLPLKYIKHTVTRARHKTGIDYVPPRDRVIELLDSGMHHRDIASKLGLEEQSVRNIKNALNKPASTAGN